MIYLILDKSNEVYDKKLAFHILHMFSDEPMTNITEFNPLIDRDTLAKNISFAIKYDNPVISDEVVEELVKSFGKNEFMYESLKEVK